MKQPRLRALVLAAGLGTRLRPLTLSVPKPLLPVCGEPVAGRTLEALSRAGCEAAALNLHYLGDQVAEHFGESFGDLVLRYSREEEIQGTLGALVPLRSFLAQADAVLVINGDALCDWPIERLVRHHLRRGAAATLLLSRDAPAEAFGGGVGIDSEGRVVQLRQAPEVGPVDSRHVFTGAQVLSPELLQRLTPGPADLVGDLYIPLLAEGGVVESFLTGRRWHDLGTPARYRRAVLDWAGGRWRREGRWVSEQTEVDAEARIRASVLEAASRVAAGARVEGSVLLPGARVGEGSHVRDSILGPATILPAATHLERRLVHPLRPGYRPREGESVLGDLVLTPL